MGSLFVKRLHHKKPSITGIFGGSGEGKSWTSLKIQKLIADMEGWDINKHLKDVNVFTPLEYPEKINKILHDKELKKVNIIVVHESRKTLKKVQQRGG
jgi:ABC-type dipeptide/oligopeptide/nickel transport system ATPase component